MTLDDGGGGGGYDPPDSTIYQDPMSNLRPEKATPRDYDEREDNDVTGADVARGSRSSLRIPKYGAGAGSNPG